MARVRDFVLDCIWPRSNPPTTEDWKKEHLRKARRRDTTLETISQLKDADLKRQSREQIEALCQAAEQRITSVEDRLKTLVTVATGSAAAILAIGIPQLAGQLPDSAWMTALIMLVLYALIQLLATTRAGIKGLERREYVAPTPDDLICNTEESPEAREDRLATVYYNALTCLEEAANRKVDQMAIAHRALENFVYAVVLAAIVLALHRLL